MDRHHLLTILVILILFSQITGVTSLSLPLFLTEHQKPCSSSLPQSTAQSKSHLLSIFNHHIFPSIRPVSSDPWSFNPKNLTFSDDAYHGSNEPYATEWWYFDATLNQDYTLQFGIHIHDIVNLGIATIHCNIYHQSNPIITERILQPLSSLTISTTTPYIAIDDETIMEGNKDEEGKPDTYQISYSGDNYAFDLRYKGITNGWKGTTSAGGWAVIFPKATVQGTFTLQNTTMKSSGIGYHDHNWNVTASSGLNFGWLWGKTSVSNVTFTWANIFETWYKGSPLLVINEDNGGYTNIPSSNLQFLVTDLAFKNGMIIPTGFSLYGKVKEYRLSLQIEVLNSDYITILGLINYWRYHIHITGSFTYNEKTKDIDDYNIAEFIRFRPY
jgi:predicted secreted hydrolase